MSYVQNEMSEAYEVKVPKQIEMTITIVGMTFKFSEKDIIEKLKKQNDFLNNSELEVIKLFEYKRNGRTIFNAKIKIDNDSYGKVMSVEKINFEWDRCKIYDGTDIIQCFKCKGYNHKAVKCKSQVVCYKCRGNHKSNECNKDIQTATKR